MQKHIAIHYSNTNANSRQGNPSGACALARFCDFPVFLVISVINWSWNSIPQKDPRSRISPIRRLRCFWKKLPLSTPHWYQNFKRPWRSLKKQNEQFPLKWKFQCLIQLLAKIAFHNNFSLWRLTVFLKTSKFLEIYSKTYDLLTVGFVHEIGVILFNFGRSGDCTR